MFSRRLSRQCKVISILCLVACLVAVALVGVVPRSIVRADSSPGGLGSWNDPQTISVAAQIEAAGPGEWQRVADTTFGLKAAGGDCALPGVAGLLGPQCMAPAVDQVYSSGWSAHDVVSYSPNGGYSPTYAAFWPWNSDGSYLHQFFYHGNDATLRVSFKTLGFPGGAWISVCALSAPCQTAQTDIFGNFSAGTITLNLGNLDTFSGEDGITIDGSNVWIVDTSLDGGSPIEPTSTPVPSSYPPGCRAFQGNPTTAAGRNSPLDGAVYDPGYSVAMDAGFDATQPFSITATLVGATARTSALGILSNYPGASYPPGFFYLPASNPASSWWWEDGATSDALARIGENNSYPGGSMSPSGPTQFRIGYDLPDNPGAALTWEYNTGSGWTIQAAVTWSPPSGVTAVFPAVYTTTLGTASVSSAYVCGTEFLPATPTPIPTSTGTVSPTPTPPPATPTPIPTSTAVVTSTPVVLGTSAPPPVIIITPSIYITGTEGGSNGTSQEICPFQNDITTGDNGFLGNVADAGWGIACAVVAVPALSGKVASSVATDLIEPSNVMSDVSPAVDQLDRLSDDGGASNTNGISLTEVFSGTSYACPNPTGVPETVENGLWIGIPADSTGAAPGHDSAGTGFVNPQAPGPLHGITEENGLSVSLCDQPWLTWIPRFRAFAALALYLIMFLWQLRYYRGLWLSGPEGGVSNNDL